MVGITRQGVHKIILAAPICSLGETSWAAPRLVIAQARIARLAAPAIARSTFSARAQVADKSVRIDIYFCTCMDAERVYIIELSLDLASSKI